MKRYFLFLIIPFFTACVFTTSKTTTTETTEEVEVSKDSINKVVENWHAAAANANYEEYFDQMTNDGVFIGTDATENWQNQEFRNFAKPHFDNGKAWSFSTVERNIYTSQNGESVWFDELLDTQMGLCRGSGVLVQQDGRWKIRHYVLSIVIPNENVSEVTELKKEFDSTYISKRR